MPRFDYDPGPTVVPQAQPRVDADVQAVGLVAVVDELLAVVSDIPWHAYCRWRESGDIRDLDQVRDWQARRDGVVGRARWLVDG